VSGQLRLLDDYGLHLRSPHEAMLRTVVEIALQSLPLAVTGLDNSGARATQFFHASSQLYVQPRVLERDPCRRQCYVALPSFAPLCCLSKQHG
jgi:hypothetical protein